MQFWLIYQGVKSRGRIFGFCGSIPFENKKRLYGFEPACSYRNTSFIYSIIDTLDIPYRKSYHISIGDYALGSVGLQVGVVDAI